MASVSDYPLGAPCWFELGTTDQAAAKQFYGQLFGWSINDSPMGPDQYYTMFEMDGASVGAAYSLAPKTLEQGVVPQWGVYFATPDVDETASRVAGLGGTLVQPPFDVMEVGRMAIVKDPGDAIFSLWQPKQHRGAGVWGRNNSVCWCELATWDTAQAREFYTGLFHWRTKGSANMASYIEFNVGGAELGGLLPMDDHWKGIPSHWGIYFLVADCDAAAARAKSLGGAVRYGPFDAPGVGRIAALVDPQGAVFSLITLSRAA